MMLILGKYDFSSKYRCQALGNLYDKAKNIRYTKYSKIKLSDVCLTPLQEKLIAPILL